MTKKNDPYQISTNLLKINEVIKSYFKENYKQSLDYKID